MQPCQEHLPRGYGIFSLQAACPVPNLYKMNHESFKMIAALTVEGSFQSQLLEFSLQNENPDQPVYKKNLSSG